MRISYFIDDYSTRAMHALDFKHENEQAVALALSPTERTRLQRPFFRHELYSRVFPVDLKTRSHSPVSAKTQFDRFLARIEPWEAEEVSCVHQYFTSLIRGFVAELEDQVVEAVLAAPGVRRPPTLAHSSFPSPAKRQRIRAPTARGLIDDSFLPSSKPLQTESDGWRGRDNNSDMVLMNCLELTDLALFSEDWKDRSASVLSHLASLGSKFIYHLINADRNQRKDIILKNTLLYRDFLPEALDHGPETGPEINIPDGVRDNQPSRPNLGYYLFTRKGQGTYLRIRSWGTWYCPLRERAFVFWDAERIVRPAVWANLREARDMDYRKANLLFGAHSYRSVEERLEGVRIPRAEKKRIEEEFGHHGDYVLIY